MDMGHHVPDPSFDVMLPSRDSSCLQGGGILMGQFYCGVFLGARKNTRGDDRWLVWWMVRISMFSYI